MPKTPDEIKKGLEYLSIKDIVKKLDMWKEGIAYDYAEDAAADALALIQQLEEQCKHMNDLRDAAAERALKMEERVHQLEAERDAAVKALKDFGGCMACKSANVLKRDSPCKECILDGQVTRDYWIWRGVQKEDTP